MTRREEDVRKGGKEDEERRGEEKKGEESFPGMEIR